VGFGFQIIRLASTNGTYVVPLSGPGSKVNDETPCTTNDCLVPFGRVHDTTDPDGVVRTVGATEVGMTIPRTISVDEAVAGESSGTTYQKSGDADCGAAGRETSRVLFAGAACSDEPTRTARHANPVSHCDFMTRLLAIYGGWDR
jgi:hypothetical protein